MVVAVYVCGGECVVCVRVGLCVHACACVCVYLYVFGSDVLCILADNDTCSPG